MSDPSPIEQPPSNATLREGLIHDADAGSVVEPEKRVLKARHAAQADEFAPAGDGVGAEITSLKSGKKLYIKCVGTGPPVLFIHGLGGSLEVFSTVAPELSKTHMVILYNFEGTGGTASRLSLWELVEDAAEVLALHSSSDPAIVVAHSMGSLVALHLAISHPNKVAGLILLNPVIALDEERRSGIVERANLARSDGMSAIAHKIAASETAPSSDPSVPRLIAELLARQDPRTYARQCEALVGAENPDWVKLRTLPVLLVLGRAYCASPEASNEIDVGTVSELDNVTTVTLNNCGLWPAFENTQETLNALRIFLDSLEERAYDGELQEDAEISDALAAFSVDSTHSELLRQILALCTRFEHTGSPSIIEKARCLLLRLPSDNVANPSALVTSLFARARISHVLYDFNLSGAELVVAHETYEKARCLMDEEHMRSGYIGDEICCCAIWIKTFHFAYVLKMGDLSSDLDILEGINKRTKDTDAMKVRVLLCLCRAWRWQWYHRGWGPDTTPLERAAGYGREALRLVPPDWLDLPMLLSEVGACLVDMQQGKQQPGPIIEAVDAFDKAADILRAQRHPRIRDSWAVLGQSGRAYARLCYLEGRLSDLDKAVDCFRELILLASNAELPSSGFTNLASFLMDRFSMTGQITDIDEAISIVNQLLEKATTSGTNKDWAMVTLALSHSRRYLYLADPVDFDAAKIRLEDVLQRSDANGFSNPLAKSAPFYLALIHMHRYDQEGAQEDIDSAIDFARRSVSAAGGDLAVLEGRTATLGLCLSKRFDLTGDPPDLAEAISLHERTLSIIPTIHPSRFAVLWHYGSALRAHYVWSEDSEYYYKSVEVLKEAVEGAKRYHHPGQSLCVFELGRVFAVHYERTKDETSLQEALRYYVLAAGMNEGNTKDRFAAAVEGAEVAHHYGDMEASYGLYSTAVGLLPRVAWVGLDSRSRHARLSSTAFQVACDAAAICLSVGRPERAVELLDAGRTILWSSILEIRTDLTELQAVAPELAAELTTVGQTLATEDPGVETVSEKQAEQRAQHRRRTAERWESLITEVRKLDGFETFLEPLSFSKLQQAAAGGPIVIVNVSKHRSDALIVTVNEPVRVVPLQLSIDMVRQMARIFEASLRLTHDRRGLQFLEQCMHNIGRSLWNAGLNTVATHILHRSPQPRAPQRLWLLAAGISGLLPVHCAGPHDGHNNGLADLFIQSYTTTLSSLLKARTTVAARGKDAMRLLAISQPNVNGMPYLHSAKPEMDVIGSLSLADSSKTFLPRACTPSECLAVLPAHSWVHCCAHGTRNAHNPLSNAIRFSGGSLTLSQIVQLDLSATAEFAFLSACHTARQTSTLPDEAMHFAAGLQIAGFRSVVGTAWSMADVDGPLLTSLFYNRLIQTGGLKIERTAEALATAVNFMRSKGLPIYRWGAFVHYGL